MSLRDRLINTTADLLYGQEHTFTQDGLEITYHVYWETADHADISIVDVKIIRPKTLLESLLDIRKLKYLEWYPTLSQTPAFKKWDARIKNLCNRIDRLEAAKKVDWHDDILPAAQKLCPKISRSRCF